MAALEISGCIEFEGTNYLEDIKAVISGEK
jgi:hypothetical protein